MQLSAFYVTGTDTGIGKTMGSTALLHALRARGHTAVGMKPVASGCEQTAHGWRNEDALALQAASDPQPDYATLNPYALPARWRRNWPPPMSASPCRWSRSPAPSRNCARRPRWWWSKASAAGPRR